MGMPNQTAQRLMYGYLRDGYRDVALFPVDLCRGQVHQRAYRGLGGRCWSYSAPIARQTGHDKLLGGAVAHVGKAHQDCGREPGALSIGVRCPSSARSERSQRRTCRGSPCCRPRRHGRRRLSYGTSCRCSTAR